MRKLDTGESSSSFSQKPSTTKAFPPKPSTASFSLPSHRKGCHLVTLGRLAGLIKHRFHKRCMEQAVPCNISTRPLPGTALPSCRVVRDREETLEGSPASALLCTTVPWHACATSNVAPALCCAPPQECRTLPSISHVTQARLCAIAAQSSLLMGLLHLCQQWLVLTWQYIYQGIVGLDGQSTAQCRHVPAY